VIVEDIRLLAGMAGVAVITSLLILLQLTAAAPLGPLAGG